MQEFKHEAMPAEQHFTQANTAEKLQDKMNELQAKMKDDGFTETKRVKLGRNDPCPCGSGKKFKKCHLDKAI